MTQRQCRRGHLVDDETARFCPLCGAMLDVPAPEALAAGDRLKRQAKARRTIGRAVLSAALLLAFLGYLLKYGQALQLPQIGILADAPIITPSPMAPVVVVGTPVERASPSPSAPRAAPTPRRLVPTIDFTNCTLDVAFVQDETLPDGTQLHGGTEVAKEWRVRNSGTCPWGPGVELVRADNNDLGLEERLPVGDCQRGEVTVLRVVVRVPPVAGTYRGDWRLCVSGDNCFGPLLFAQVVSLGPPPTDAR